MPAENFGKGGSAFEEPSVSGKGAEQAEQLEQRRDEIFSKAHERLIAHLNSAQEDLDDDVKFLEAVKDPQKFAEIDMQDTKMSVSLPKDIFRDPRKMQEYIAREEAALPERQRAAIAGQEAKISHAESRRDGQGRANAYLEKAREALRGSMDATDLFDKALALLAEDETSLPAKLARRSEEIDGLTRLDLPEEDTARLKNELADLQRRVDTLFSVRLALEDVKRQHETDLDLLAHSRDQDEAERQARERFGLAQAKKRDHPL